MPTLTDARGRAVALEHPPQRIISLVPSTTETLLALGAPVVGVTRFCVHPSDVVKDLPKVGGTKDVDPDRVAALQPDLIIGNCEENTREIFEALDPIAPTFAAFPRTVDQAMADLLDLGTLIGRSAADHHAEIDAQRGRHHAPLRVAYLIWRDPWMAINDDTFIASMLREAGMHNVFAEHPDRFPMLSVDELREADPERILLSSEPFPFRARHAEELAEATGLPRERFVAIDGEMVSWHGVRMAQGLAALHHWREHGFEALR